MGARLRALDQDQVLSLDRPLTLVGRHAECDLQLESTKISRKHCLLVLLPAELIVRDLESTNGVRVNGEKVAEGRLQAGDQLTIGNMRYQFEIDAEHSVSASSFPKPVAKPSGPAAGIPVRPVDAANLVSCEFPIPIMEPERHPGTVGPTYGSDEQDHGAR